MRVVLQSSGSDPICAATILPAFWFSAICALRWRAPDQKRFTLRHRNESKPALSAKNLADACFILLIPFSRMVCSVILGHPPFPPQVVQGSRFAGNNFNLRCFGHAVFSTRPPWLSRPGWHPGDRSVSPRADAGMFAKKHASLVPRPSDTPPVLFLTPAPSDAEGFGIGR